MKSHTVAQYYRPRRFTIRVPQSHARASYLLAFYVIETLLYDILHVIAEHRGLTKDPEHLATQLSHIALFGDNAKKFLYSVQNHAPGAENILEAMGRLHDDKNYDIPLAKALTYVSSMDDSCSCSHVHYKVKPEAKHNLIAHQFQLSRLISN